MAGNKKENLTMKMLAALAAGLIAGLGAIVIRENVNPETWDVINRLLFADISAPGNESAAGLFYIAGQLFVRSLQLIIVPMVFTSIVLAMIRISDSRKLGRISARTLGYFLATTLAGIILASAAGMAAYSAGAFRSAGLDLAASEGKTGTNALMIIVNAVPNNFISALSNNSGVLAVVVTALAVGLCINARRDRIEIIPKICREISDIITVFLTFTVNKFGPVAIFCLISRTCASYGIAYLKPALAYVLLTTALLLLILFAGYALFVKITTGLNPVPFVKKTARVALFGFSTSSSAAALPLNMKTATEELGVHEEIASFVLPLGMTVNMDGTAVMQVIAAIFIAGCAGYDISVQTVLMIGVLAVIASIGTPAAPGAGAVILFTILSGAGFTNETALMTYSLILAINRPIEMLVTALNVAGDTACAVAVAKSENALDEKVYAAGTDRQ
ncbi:MAG: dicarboxylate/amino acid:cation symporter [Solobacterium sp.]|nr:dicarboxylate/amino acid:cation symporter [Solobacterium sp.]